MNNKNKDKKVRREKSLGLACLKQVLYFNRERQPVLFDYCALCIKRSALLLLFPSYQLDFMLSELKFNTLFWESQLKLKSSHKRNSCGEREEYPCSLISHESDEEEAEPAAVPTLQSFPGVFRSTTAICSRLLIKCIFNWAVYLKRKSMVVLTAVWSLNKALQSP